MRRGLLNKENLCTGNITEEQLVRIFGNSKQQLSYIENGRFISNNKKYILNEASRYCEIIDKGNRIYSIEKLLSYPIGKSFNKMQKSLYKYICPLILSKLIDGHDENGKIDFTYNRWARQIEMINSNYSVIKKNISWVSNVEIEFKDRCDDMYDYFSRVDTMISNYLSNSLKYLQEVGCVVCRDVYRIDYLVIDKDTTEIDQNGVVHVGKKTITHQASDKEFNYYTKCIKYADKIAGITGDHEKERYYSTKSQDFKKALSKKLWEKNIKNVYKTYEVYYLDLDKCEYYINLFVGKKTRDEFLNEFNNEFKDLILANAKKRN
jgi:hypothetical protein